MIGAAPSGRGPVLPVEDGGTVATCVSDLTLTDIGTLGEIDLGGNTITLNTLAASDLDSTHFLF